MHQLIPGGESVDTILALRGVYKSYGAVEALQDVSLSFERNEIHAIVGENGAGKSTLIKLLTGVTQRTRGEIEWEGLPASLATPHEAMARGINAVHQEVVLCGHLTVAANIFLGDEISSMGIIDKRGMISKAQELLDDLGFDLPASELLGNLTIGQQQLVATARAAMRGTRFLIFDEPTGYLTRQEAEQLFSLIRRLRAEGVTIVYISHRLEEIFELADRVSVLRDGSLVGTRAVSETHEAELVRMMIDRSIEQVYHKQLTTIGETLLETQGLSGRGFSDVSISVRRGEIVGLYGLIGAGRSEFAMTVFGRASSTKGAVLWKGRPVDILHERKAIDLGMAMVPESRRDQGLNLNLSIGLNLNLPTYDRLTRGFLISRRDEANAADAQIASLGIKAPSRRSLASSMSGGNQQKVVIGKWVNHGADLFIFDEPTVGVDVATKAEIYRLFASLLKQGAGILLISSYLPEVYELADTLHVFRTGRVAFSAEPQTVSQEKVLAEAIGI